jgi:uncharacterized protein (TIGR00251 family)
MKLALKIIPNAKKSEAAGWEDDPRAGRVLKLRIAAPPVEGKANRAVILFLSAWLDVPRSSVSLLRGESARLKVVELPDGCAEKLACGGRFGRLKRLPERLSFPFLHRGVVSGSSHHASNVIHVLRGR